MPNATIQAAAEGMPNTARRNLLLGLATATTAAAIAVVPTAHAADAQAEIQAENPELISAYARFVDARTKMAEAKNSLEWLADEWRHRWPLAPEALLVNANADNGRYDHAERDIIGRYLYRDTCDLTRRFSAKQRRELPRVCFQVRTSEELRQTRSEWEARTPKGRTEKALARNIAFREEVLRECDLLLPVAERYEAETTSLRAMAGAAAKQMALALATKELLAASDDISFLPVRTLAGLEMKAEALQPTAGKLMELSMDDRSGLGQLARFIKSVVEVSEVTA